MRHAQPPPIIPRLPDNDLFQVLDYWVTAQPDALLFSFLDSRGDVLEELTYGQFAQVVDRLAGHLQQTIEADRGDRVFLCYQPGLELNGSLFACNKAGFVGVPTLPLAVHQLPAWLYSVGHVLDDSQAAGVAMCNRTWDIFDACEPGDADGISVCDRLMDLGPLVTTGLANTDPGPCALEPCDTFLLQYTSGSTTEPKGVMVSHSNLIANAQAVVDHPCPVSVSWLPQHHDMGLIGYYINIVLSGGRTYGFAPASFIKRPAMWLEVISRYGATASSITNFALELCLNDRRVPSNSLDQFDLSSLSFLMVAAEPVNPDIFFGFLEKFTPCGLNPESLYVAYGLAEFTLAVSSYGRRSMSLNRDALGRGAVEPAANSSGNPVVQLMSCGRPLDDTRVEIVDPEGHRQVGERRTGEVWLCGDSKSQGYWSNPELTRAAFRATLKSGRDQNETWLRTGDIGFVDEGELFICGRIKDMLIINGCNIYPQDIEHEIQKTTSKIRRNGVVAFADENGGDITVLAELVKVRDVPDALLIIHAIRDRLQIPVSELVFLAPHSVAKTSSGKIRRAKTRQKFAEGRLEVVTDGGINRSKPAEVESVAELDELETLKRRYQLTGDEDFTLFDAGIDSLDLITLLHWLKDRCRQHDLTNLSNRITVRLLGILTVKQIFAAGSVLKKTPEIAEEWLVATIKKALSDRVQHEQRQMRDDSLYQRPDSSAGQMDYVASGNDASDILLTSGTGFVGPFLLQSLLQQTKHKIHVLVRAEDQGSADLRLRREFASTIGRSAQMDDFDARVDAVCGDLSSPQFELQTPDWERLLNQTGTVYHNGALVNYLLDYGHMKSTNVTGTRRVIDFTITGAPKVLNYISTTFIFGWATKDVLYETDRNDGMDHLDFGYSQSKWVAEQLVLSAMEQGMDACIFRPALITPSMTGRGGDVDITLRLLTFMIRHGVCVDTQNQVSFMPVDLTANNVVAVAEQPDSVGKIFHLTRDQHETMPQVTEIISEQTNIEFDAFSLKDFVPEVIQRCTREDLLYPLLDFLVESVDNIAAMEYKLYDNSGYRDARDRSSFGMQDPALEDVVAGIIDYLDRKRLLPDHALA